MASDMIARALAMKANKTLPAISSADAGKLATVDSNGKWAAADLTVGQGEVAVDSTLLVSGAAADAKATGDKVNELKSAITEIGVQSKAPDLYDVSAYSSGTIASGIAVIADSEIAANTLIQRIKLYSGVSADTNATIVIIGAVTNKCLDVIQFVCKPGWNTIELNKIVAESVRIGSYNSQPIFTNSATGDYIFSSGGLGRFLPAEPDIGDTVTPSKVYSGNFGLAMQWETATGDLFLIDYRLTNVENDVEHYEPIVYDQHAPEMTPGYYVNSSTGELSQAAWASYSDFYKIDEITDFYAAMGGLVGCCYYTFDKRYISGFDGGLEQTEKWHQLVPPDGAAYVRFSNRSGSFPNRNVKTVNRIDHRLDNGISIICAYEYTPALYDDVSDYSGGTILSGIGVVPDAIITSGVMINSVRVYSGVSEQTTAKIAIIGNTSGKCLKTIEFACNSGWNTITVNDSFAEGVRVGIYNARPLYVTGATGSYVFSSSGLGRFLPADIAIGETATISKVYDGNFALSVQIVTSAGELPDAEYRLGGKITATEKAACNILPMYDTFICIGDSLTFSQVFIATGTSEGTNRQAYKTYPQVLASLCGGVSYNYATPGDTGVSWWQRSSSGAFDHHGLYIVFLGTNEGFTDTIDTDCPGSDPDDFDKTTNTGAYGAILQTIKNNGDKAVLITPWGGGGSSLATTKAVINKFSEKYGFPVIDVDAPERTASVYHLYPDGTGQNLLHFNDLGYVWLANEVKKQINLLDYADKFKIMRTQ